MTEPTVNIPLLRKAVEWAEAEAAKPVELCEWEQSEWVTTPEDRIEAVEYLDIQGKAPTSETYYGRMALKAPECGTCYCIAGFVASTVDPQPSDSKYVAERAASLLGLSEHEASPLFAGGNTIEDVRRIAESIAGERL